MGIPSEASSFEERVETGRGESRFEIKVQSELMGNHKTLAEMTSVLAYNNARDNSMGSGYGIEPSARTHNQDGIHHLKKMIFMYLMSGANRLKTINKQAKGKLQRKQIRN
jgi:hypothetical protein